MAGLGNQVAANNALLDELAAGGITPTIFTPFDDSKEFISLGLSDDSSAWRNATLPGVPTDATVAILNVAAAVRGLSSSSVSEFAVKFRCGGCPDPNGSSLTGRATSNQHTQLFNNTVFVPVTSGSLQYQWRATASGGGSDDVRLEVKLQGYW